jgi:hypothetical protein
MLRTDAKTSYSIAVAALLVSIIALAFTSVVAVSYWTKHLSDAGCKTPCANEATYARCNPTSADKYEVACATSRLFAQAPKKHLLGDDPCTQGPAYWCASDEAFATCVEKRGFVGGRESFFACNPSDPCTHGPAYWCSSPEVYNRCVASKRKDAPAFDKYCPQPHNL